ncbi:MAG: TonB family protein, partial [candidate division NC10 bacterium]|nr:TonB family protein [candidate division NC10 bacterium]
PPPPPVVARPEPLRPPPAARPSGPMAEVPRAIPAVPAPEPLPPPRPERGGLSLGGPSLGTLDRIPAPTAPGGSSIPRRSLRDQIAGLGSGLTETDIPGKRTIPLDGPEPAYKDFRELIKRRIYRVWAYPEAARENGIGGELLLVFTLNKAGSLLGVRLMESSGFPILDQEALRAVKAAAPYDPLPPYLVDDPLNITASFHYNLPSHRFRRN